MATYEETFGNAHFSMNPDEPMVPTPEMIALHVRTWRQVRNWKKATLADFAQVSLSTIERIERAERVSEENLERVAQALGFQKGAFTDPRRILPPEEAAEKVEEMFEGMMMVPCRPLRTQPEATAILDCAFMTVPQGQFDTETAAYVAALREWLELWSFLLSDLTNPDRPVRKREIYTDLLAKVRDIERRGYTALHAVYEAKSPFGPAPVSMIAFFPKLTDPAAAKRRFLFVPAEVQMPRDDEDLDCIVEGTDSELST